MGLIAVDNFTGTEYYVDAINGSDSTGLSQGLTAGNAFQTLHYAIHTGIPFYGADTTNGDRINLLNNSTHDISTAIDLVNNRGAGSFTAPVIVQGCTYTPNDGGIATLNNAIGGNSVANSGSWSFKFVDLKITSDGSKWYSGGGGAEYYNCWLRAENGSGEFIYSNDAKFYFCTLEFDNHNFRYSITLHNCILILHANSTICGWASSNSLHCTNCIFINTNASFSNTIVSLTSARNCTFIATNGDGISGEGVRAYDTINCHVENVGTAYLQKQQGGYRYHIGNTYFNCTTTLSQQSSSYYSIGVQNNPTQLSASVFSTATGSSLVLDTSANNSQQQTVGNLTAGGLNATPYASTGFGVGYSTGGSGSSSSSGSKWTTITDLTGLLAWYKPETLASTYSNGDSISTWADSSGNGHDLTGSGTTRPLALANAFGTYMAADFDGTDDVLTFSSGYSFTSAPIATCIVHKFDTSSIYQALLFVDNASPLTYPPSHMGLRGDNADNRYLNAADSSGGGTAYAIQLNAWAESTDKIVTGAMDNIVGYSVGADGFVSENPRINTYDRPALASGTIYWTIGNSAYGMPLNGKICEVVFWTSSNWYKESVWVEGYLADKYGITLVDGHLFKNAAPQSSPTTYNATSSGSSYTNVASAKFTRLE